MAIIDIHVVRAGQVAGVFDPGWEPQRHYRQLEDAFLRLAAAIDVDAALLDAVMWEQMRMFGDIALEAVVAMRDPSVGLQGQRAAEMLRQAA